MTNTDMVPPPTYDDKVVDASIPAAAVRLSSYPAGDEHTYPTGKVPNTEKNGASTQVMQLHLVSSTDSSGTDSKAGGADEGADSKGRTEARLNHLRQSIAETRLRKADFDSKCEVKRAVRGLKRELCSIQCAAGCGNGRLDRHAKQAIKQDLRSLKYDLKCAVKQKRRQEWEARRQAGGCGRKKGCGRCGGDRGLHAA